MARIMHLRSQLQTLKKGAMSMTDFVVKMKGIVDSLMAAGQTITELDLVSYVLGGLGQEFDPVIATEAQFLLMSFEARLVQFATDTTIELPATSSNVLHRIHKDELPSNFLRENQGFRRRFKGRGRGKSGMFNNYRPTCQLGGKSGHFATVCYYRYDQSTGDFSGQQGSTMQVQGNMAQQIEYPSNSTYQVQSSDMSAMIASPSTVMDPNWYVDSGATNHITSDINNLSINSTYKGNKTLAVGNRQTLPISHVGKSFLPSNISSFPAIYLDNILFIPY
ncbi:hypothetical protein ACOSP7_003152 [Xanthoceras sorbifolium]